MNYNSPLLAAVIEHIDGVLGTTQFNDINFATVNLRCRFRETLNALSYGRDSPHNKSVRTVIEEALAEQNLSRVCLRAVRAKLSQILASDALVSPTPLGVGVSKFLQYLEQYVLTEDDCMHKKEHIEARMQTLRDDASASDDPTALEVQSELWNFEARDCYTLSEFAQLHTNLQSHLLVTSPDPIYGQYRSVPIQPEQGELLIPVCAHSLLQVAEKLLLERSQDNARGVFDGLKELQDVIPTNEYRWARLGTFVDHMLEKAAWSEEQLQELLTVIREHLCCDE